MDPKEKIEKSSEFYNKSFLGIDYRLAEFGFATLKPFFKGKLALEIGPASGYMTKQLVHEFETVHVLEPSAQLLAQVPDHKNLVKIQSTIEEHQSNTTYDTIVMSHVLEHIQDPVFALKKIYKLLAPDGVFLVAVPNAKSIHRLVAVKMGMLESEYELNQRDFDLGHYRVYDRATLEQHVKEAGFKILKSGGYFLKPVTNGQIENHWTEDMIEGFYKVGDLFPENCAEIFVVCQRK